MNYTFFRFPGFKDKAVTLSYDDGVIHDRRLISIVSKYGLKGTFNMNSGIIEKNMEGYIPLDEIKELYKKSGNEVAAHGRYHLPLADIDTASAIEDIISDRKYWEQFLDEIIVGMAYANGSSNEETAALLDKCGIGYCRTTISTHNFDMPDNWLLLNPTCHHNDEQLMELARSFVESEPSWYYLANTPKMFYLWGHSYEFNDNNNWEVIEEFAQYISNRQEIWYATNGEIYNYAMAYQRLKFSADSKKVYNPSAIDVYMCYFEKNYVVPAGQTINLDK